jgi:hypothetical protein
MNAKMDLHQERMEAAIHSMRAWQKEMMACQETMEAHLEFKEPTSEGMEFEQSIGRSPRNMVRWKLPECRISSIGASI